MSQRSDFLAECERLRRENERLRRNLAATEEQLRGQSPVGFRNGGFGDRTQMEQERRQPGPFLRRVLDNLCAYVAVVSPDGAVIDGNRRILEGLGLEREDWIGRKLTDLSCWAFDPDLQVLVGHSLQRAVEGKVVRFDLVMHIQPQRQIWVDLQIAPLRDDDGNITHLVVSALDITGRRRVEEALRSSEERLRLAAQATGFGTYDHDPVTGRQEVWSSEFHRICGLSCTVVPSFDLFRGLIHPDDVAGFDQLVWPSAVPGPQTRFHELEYRIIRPDDGEVRWVRDVGRAFFVLDGDGGNLRVVRMVGTVQDITRRKHAELQLEGSLRQLQEAQEQLIRRERLATLGQLAGGVAHELRTPLGVMRNAVYYLDQSLPPTEIMGQVLGEMNRAIRTTDQIIEEMLEFVREPCLEKTTWPVGRVIASALSLVPMPHGIRVVGPDGEMESRVQANEDQIVRILVNLMQNAVQAMGREGELQIRVERRAGGAGPGTVWISVRDTGCGIPVENLARIFDPLFTTKTRGIGLGLAISMRYAEMNQGSILVESEVGVGTTFRLELQGAVSEGANS
jgi:PAS domain S-box-containing protein